MNNELAVQDPAWHEHELRNIMELPEEFVRELVEEHPSAG